VHHAGWPYDEDLLLHGLSQENQGVMIKRFAHLNNLRVSGSSHGTDITKAANIEQAY
jgi:hypothetical protein